MDEQNTLRERVEASIRNSELRFTDFGSYDWTWLDHPEDRDSVAWELQWLREAEDECRMDGYGADAEAYADLRKLILEELASY